MTGRCACGQDRFEILGCDGSVVLRFIKLDDGTFYGGAANFYGNEDFFSDFGALTSPHARSDLGYILDLLTRLAGDRKKYALWEIVRTGSLGHHRTQIARQMRVYDLARCLDCSEEAIREHFAATVTLT